MNLQEIKNVSIDEIRNIKVELCGCASCNVSKSFNFNLLNQKCKLKKYENDKYEIKAREKYLNKNKDCLEKDFVLFLKLLIKLNYNNFNILIPETILFDKEGRIKFTIYFNFKEKKLMVKEKLSLNEIRNFFYERIKSNRTMYDDFLFTSQNEIVKNKNYVKYKYTNEYIKLLNEIEKMKDKDYLCDLNKDKNKYYLLKFNNQQKVLYKENDIQKLLLKSKNNKLFKDILYIQFHKSSKQANSNKNTLIINFNKKVILKDLNHINYRLFRRAKFIIKIRNEQFPKSNLDYISVEEENNFEILLFNKNIILYCSYIAYKIYYSFKLLKYNIVIFKIYFLKDLCNNPWVNDFIIYEIKKNKKLKLNNIKICKTMACNIKKESIVKDKIETIFVNGLNSIILKFKSINKEVPIILNKNYYLFSELLKILIKENITIYQDNPIIYTDKYIKSWILKKWPYIQKLLNDKAFFKIKKISKNLIKTEKKLPRSKLILLRIKNKYKNKNINRIYDKIDFKI